MVFGLIKNISCKKYLNIADGSDLLLMLAMSFLGRRDRFHPFKIAANAPDKFLLMPDRALTDLTVTSLTWGSHLLPMGLSVYLGFMADVSSCAPAVDVSGHGTTPHAGWTHPGPCLTMVLLTPGLCTSPFPGR